MREKMRENMFAFLCVPSGCVGAQGVWEVRRGFQIFRSPGAGVAGRCELPNMGAGI